MEVALAHRSASRKLGMNSVNIEDLWKQAYAAKGSDLKLFIKGHTEGLATVESIRFIAGGNGRFYDSKGSILGPSTAEYLYSHYRWEVSTSLIGGKVVMHPPHSCSIKVPPLHLWVPAVAGLMIVGAKAQKATPLLVAAWVCKNRPWRFVCVR